MHIEFQWENLRKRDLQGGQGGEDNNKMELREVGCDPGEWMDIAEDRDQCGAYVRAVINLQVPLKSHLVS